MATQREKADALLARLKQLGVKIGPPPVQQPFELPELSGADSDEAVRLRREIRRAAKEVVRRKAEGLSLYDPLPTQQQFHECIAPERLLRGSNRAGKTLASAVEIARMVTGQDPHDKFPKRDGMAYMVALDEFVIGQVMFKKLFRRGAFRVIRDQESGRWRTWRPFVEADAKLKHLSKPAPPLIPQRFIEHIAWNDKGKGIPKTIKFTTGWELSFFSSNSRPPQGMALDAVIFDEEIADGEWYGEMAARLLDKQGRFWWAATPQAGNEKLLTLSDRAAKEMADGEPNPITVEIILLLDENPHIGEAEKKRFLSVLEEDDADVRIGGEFAASKWKVYPEFFRSTHVVRLPEIPREWTRYACIDPGRQVCAVLFAAVPPPKSQGFDIVCYDELYIKNCSAAIFGQKMALKVYGQRDPDRENEWTAPQQFYKFVIDRHMGRQYEMGSGQQVEKQYSEALKANKVECKITKHGFTAGFDDVDAGIELVRAALSLTTRPSPGNGPALPRLVVREGYCPNLLEEFKRYRYKRDPKTKKPTDVPEDRGNVHLMADLRYLLGAKPKYVTYVAPPEERVMYDRFLKKREKERHKRGGTIQLGPTRN